MCKYAFGLAIALPGYFSFIIDSPILIHHIDREMDKFALFNNDNGEGMFNDINVNE